MNPAIVPAPHVELSPAYPERAAWGTAPSLRAWQFAAVEKYFAENPQEFLAAASKRIAGFAATRGGWWRCEWRVSVEDPRRRWRPRTS